MTRYLPILGAVALAAQAVPALAVPPAYHPVYHSMAAPAARGASGSQMPLKMPFVLRHEARTIDPQASWNPLRWHGWHPIPGSLSYQPIWYQTGCYPYTGPLATWASLSAPIGLAAPPPNFTIGSLVDGESNPLRSSPSDVAQIASTGNAPTSSPLTFQYGVGAAPCTLPNSPPF